MMIHSLKPKYGKRDEFLTNLTAGNVHGAVSTPSGSSRTVVDTTSMLHVSDAPQFSFKVIAASSITGVFQTVAGQTITVFWGDGTSNTYTGTTDQAYSKTYSGSGTYTIVIHNSRNMTKWTITSTSGVFFDLSAMALTGLTYFYCSGNNTITGNLSSLPANMTYFNCQGSNTITGNLSSLPVNMATFACTGSNTITGNLSSLPANMTSFYCTGSNTISDYTTRTWANNQQRVYLIPVAPGGLDSTEVDQLLIDLAAAGGTWTGDKQVYIKGTCAARTAASDAAVATLLGKGVSVTTN